MSKELRQRHAPAALQKLKVSSAEDQYVMLQAKSVSDAPVSNNEVKNILRIF